MSAHSPGPWRWAANRDGEARLLAANDDIVVVGVSVSAASMAAGVEVYSSADARLIAAAPELLEWLKVFHPMRCQTGVRCDACALIARIEGEP